MDPSTRQQQSPSQPPMKNDLEAMKRRMKEMEEEAEKLRQLQMQMEQDMSTTAGPSSEEIDARSVYVGNVDYSATPEDLQQHFQACGPINRITILCDRFSGHPKGFAYVEFGDEGCVKMAVALSETVLKGRVIKVVEKRTNVPGFNWRGGRGRGRGGRGRFMNRGGPRGRGKAFAPY